MNQTTPVAPPPRWRWCRFGGLSAFELEAIFRARQRVFVVEQACAYLDADGYDTRAFHLAAWSQEHDIPLAYARVIPPGLKFAEPSIGRVLTSSKARGIGLGRELLRRAVQRCGLEFPGHAVRISAQSHLQPFYGEAGFRPVGAIYLEDNIPHIEMLRTG